MIGDSPFPFAYQISVGDRLVDPTTVIELLRPRLTENRWRRIRRVANARSFHVTTVLEGVHDAGNVFAVLRTCEAFGFPEVHTINQPSEAQAARPRGLHRVSQGAHNWLEIHEWPDTPTCLTSLRARGYQVCVTTVAAGSVPLEQLRLEEPLAIVLGNEHTGVRPETAATADQQMVIPMRGMVRSLNISVAAAVTLRHCSLQLADLPRATLNQRQRQVVQARYLLRCVARAERIVLAALGQN